MILLFILCYKFHFCWQCNTCISRGWLKQNVCMIYILLFWNSMLHGLHTFLKTSEFSGPSFLSNWCIWLLEFNVGYYFSYCTILFTVVRKFSSHCAYCLRNGSSIEFKTIQFNTIGVGLLSFFHFNLTFFVHFYI